MNNLEQRINAAREAIIASDYLLIGGGAGLSAAAGLDYGGKRFTDNFADFIEKYGITDMYAGSFYPFETEAESWAHWARHIDVNRYAMPATRLYQDIFELAGAKEYFVLSTNVESQFVKGGFPAEKVFEVQGDYAFIQCAKACHDTLYDNAKLIKKMLAATADCKIPSELVPKCPVCGGSMDVNLRHNQYFVQDQAWYAAEKRYEAFLSASQGKKLTLLEFGVGFNTPGIIRYPFETMTYQNPHATLIRFNRDYPMGAAENTDRTISFSEAIGPIVTTLLKKESEQ
ncbi:Sir2 silent information regulator family NAD-dependent deacetylase [Acetobacterium malicum]|uniref:Sir2 silent information regulator family NAD-dependent deacetylase n=1 Tax=Acetobacterium malicum TaxID=52692 RepID=UPI000416B071|nr:Sir2 silent information regulator family NAD-dependent deacetylase [Acetobacterium dehalogenans]